MVKKPKNISTKNKLTSLLTKRKSIVIGFIGVLGITTLLLTQAATGFSISIEPEIGTKSGSVTPLNDATASNGKYIKFGTVTPPPTGGHPTEGSTGPTVSNPSYVGDVVVERGETRNIQQATANSIVVKPGGKLTISNVAVNQWIYIMNRNGDPMTTFHMTDSSAKTGLRTNTVDQLENLDWGHTVSGDIIVEGSWIRHPQGIEGDHTEALSSFGWPRGVVFNNTTFIQDGPFNGTATATINWHGNDTIFDNCYFGWNGQVAAWYTVYVEGSNNVVRNSKFEPSRGGYIYPESTPMATYVNNVDAFTGVPL